MLHPKLSELPQVHISNVKDFLEDGESGFQRLSN